MFATFHEHSVLFNIKVDCHSFTHPFDWQCMFNRRNSDRLGNYFRFRWTIPLTDPLLFSVYLFILPEKLARVQFPSMTSSFFRPDLNFENTSEREQEVCMCVYMHMFDSYTNCYLMAAKYLCKAGKAYRQLTYNSLQLEMCHKHSAFMILYSLKA